MGFGQIHVWLRALANSAISSFFSQIVVVDYDSPEADVSREPGPFLVVCNHWNSAVDPAVLSCRFPYGHRLHYWAKSTLFKPGFPAKVLLSAGNLPVDRRNKVSLVPKNHGLVLDSDRVVQLKDNQKLFASTFDVLKLEEGVAIFPEGGSFTTPGMSPIKDGTAWAALEYGKNIRATGRKLSNGKMAPSEPKDVRIFIAGISYTDKSKYRSSVVMKFGRTIDTSKYIEDFMLDPKATVKRLTKEIEERLREVTVNAADWDSLNAATMARKMLWTKDRNLPMAHLSDIGQTLVDIFSTSDDKEVEALKTLLVAYHTSLRRSKLTHFTLSGVPLPASLDPSRPYPFPTRFRTLAQLLMSTTSSLIRLPFFVLPLLAHLPIYLIGKYSLRFSDDEEDFAQNKIVLGLVFAAVLFPLLGSLTWYILFRTPLGGLVAAGFIYLFAVYHNRMVDNQYDAAKKLVASLRVLVGIWAPRARSEAVAALRRVGIEASVEGENDVCRTLRLRIEANAALADFMERGKQRKDERVLRLIAWGASFKKIARPDRDRGAAGQAHETIASIEIGSPVFSEAGIFPE